jgi:hypothetical protein
MQFCTHGTDRFGSKQMYVAKAEYGKDGDSEEHYSQATDPMRHHAPEE